MKISTLFSSRFRTAIAALLLSALLPGGALAAEEVGGVSRLQNSAEAETEGITRALSDGAAINMGDLVTTGPEARLEITFLDGTTLTLGENASLTVDSFVYQPEQGEGEFLATIEGAFRFVTGQMGVIDGKQVTMNTPLATIGIRGTDFWGGPIDERYGVFLLDGSVEVTTEAGTATLDAPGTGVNLLAADAPPGDVTVWPDDKVARAVASVTFQ